jgi:hypothetical protein
MKHSRSVPPATVVPIGSHPDVRAAVAWLSAASGLVERTRTGESHRAQMSIGADAAVIVAERRGEKPAQDDEVTHLIRVRVEDVSAQHAGPCARSTRAGAAHRSGARRAGLHHGGCGRPSMAVRRDRAGRGARGMRGSPAGLPAEAPCRRAGLEQASSDATSPINGESPRVQPPICAAGRLVDACATCTQIAAIGAYARPWR